MNLFKGIARKLVLPFIALTAFGWLLVVIGFGIGSNTDTEDYDWLLDSPYQWILQTRKGLEMYLYWAVCVSGPFTLAAAIAHAALWKPFSPFAGAATTFLSVFFLTGLGMILYLNGEIIREVNEFNMDCPYYEPCIDIPTYFKLEFAGAILATLFWTPVMILRHFYDGFGAATMYQELK